MHISFVVPDNLTIRGGTKRVVEYASRLGQRGHRVSILTGDKKIPEWLAPYYSGFRLVDINEYRHFKTDVAIATGGRAARRLGRMTRAKVKAYSVVMLESLNKPTEKHGKKIDRDRFLQDPYDQGWIYYANSSWMRDIVEQQFGQKCHLILTPSHERMKPSKSFKPEGKMWILGYGGNSSWKQGHKTAEAVEIAKKTLPNLEMIHYSQKSCPRSKVVVQHWSSPAQDFLPQIYSSADLFCHSSRFEGWSNTCAEAMSCGTPVVSYKTRGVEDIVIHEKTGLIVDEMNVEKMADAIVQMLGDREELKRYQERCLAHAATFSWDKALTELEEILRP